MKRFAIAIPVAAALALVASAAPGQALTQWTERHCRTEIFVVSALQKRHAELLLHVEGAVRSVRKRQRRLLPDDLTRVR